MAKLSEQEQEKIKDAIEWAEKSTSGEIRVCLEKHCKLDPYQRALECFYDLGMEQTQQKNGVLIYIATEDHKLAILGDEGISKLVPDNFWHSTKDLMIQHFKNGNLAEGISVGVIEAGKQLKKFFPYQDGDANELSDDIVFLS
ncbi:TPM domain-containing protein [Pseudopedobacter sp.]|uniref:TPM domain-containing protein n=1 Tax=Pseudopedobacter sp. TaxID=1936787 RepID=UPI00333FDAC8